MDAEIAERVIKLAAEKGGVDPSQVTRETDFMNDLEYDSLDVAEFVMELEDEFECSIPDEDVEKLKTVGRVVDFIIERRKADITVS